VSTTFIDVSKVAIGLFEPFALRRTVCDGTSSFHSTLCSYMLISLYKQMATLGVHEAMGMKVDREAVASLVRLRHPYSRVAPIDG
jgi:hypothetical protein